MRWVKFGLVVSLLLVSVVSFGLLDFANLNGTLPTWLPLLGFAALILGLGVLSLDQL